LRYNQRRKRPETEFAIMSSKRRCASVVAAVWLASAISCTPTVPVDQLPPVSETLANVGQRLSRSHSAAELTALATRGERLLSLLSTSERDALARGHIRFKVDRPVIVYVAAPADVVLFWLSDQHFARTGLLLRNAEGPFVLFRKSFAAGWVGLGVNGLDRSSSAHYAVFVCPANSRSKIVLSDISPYHYQTTRAEGGASPYVDSHRPFERLPAELLGSTLLRTALDDRHSALLVKGRAWKTHVPSGDRPDQVVISFGADAATSLTWTWRTGPGVDSSAVRFAPAASGSQAPANPNAVRIARGESQWIQCGSVLNNPSTRRHCVSVGDLEPDTLYAYSLGDGTARGWSEWHTVRTGPSAGRDFEFLYVGDAQTGFEAWGRLIQSAVARHPDARFLLMAGDLVDRGNERTNWDHFFLRARPVFERLVMMPSVGNHEYLDQGPRLYRALFALPRNGPAGLDSNLVYAFTCGDALFAVLDSTSAVADPVSARKQAEWLDATLDRNRASWSFVMFHHPVYASHTTREQPQLREAWLPVFDKHRVTMVLQGHDHAYLRTYPLRQDGRAAEGETGTVYVVSVSGDKFYDQNPRDVAALGLTNLSTYQLIQIRGDRLLYRAFDADGREIDSLTIENAKAQSRKRSGPPGMADDRKQPRALLLDKHSSVQESKREGPGQSDPGGPVDPAARLRALVLITTHNHVPYSACGSTTAGPRDRRDRG
jgi:Calcineurin-like phosphoesterase/Purple acid Phosphatase, N-terminal domain